MRVKIKKPKDVNERPTWVLKMDRFDGIVMPLESFSRTGRYYIFDDFAFNEDWLIPFTAAELNRGCLKEKYVSKSNKNS